MPVIPISYLPYVGQTGYTTDDLLVLVNYYDSPYTGVTKNTKISQIKDYVLSGYTFTGNTSASCINDLYVHSLHGCSPITIMDSVQSDGSSVYSGTTLGFAFGNNTLSLGDYSHAEGNETISGGKAFEIESISNGHIILPSRYGDVTSELGGTTIINGNYYGNPTQVIFVSGKTEIFINSSLSYGQNIVSVYNLNSPYADIPIGDISHSEGLETQSIGYSSHAEGDRTKSIGAVSHAEGENTISYGIGSHTEGWSTSSGVFSYRVSLVSGNTVTLSSRYGDLSGGFLPDYYLFTYGESIADVNRSYYKISGSTYDTILSSTTIFLYTEATNDIDRVTVTGSGDLSFEGFWSHAEGKDTISIGGYSHSEGFQTKSVGPFSHAEGNQTESIGGGSHSEGLYTQSLGESSHSEGEHTKSISRGSHSEGFQTKSGSIGFRVNTTSNGILTLESYYGDLTSSFIGQYVYVRDSGYDVYEYSVVNVTYSSGTNTEIFLNDTSVEDAVAVVLKDNYDLGDTSSNGLFDLGKYSHSEGSSTKSIGSWSHSEGTGTRSIGRYSHAEGDQTESIGGGSHSEGEYTISLGYGSHSEGKNTQSIGNYSHSEGGSTKSGWKGFSITGITSGIVTLNSWYGNVTSEFTGNQIVLSNGDVYFFNDVTFSSGTNTQIILNSNTINESGSLCVADINNPYSSFTSRLFGDYSHSEGGDTKAIGEGSHSEGVLTYAIGKYSHAEGQKGVFSIGYGSHAEGDATRSIGESSHSEGDTTQSIGRGSHSEGISTQSIGRGSHSEGDATQSIGRGSHSEGTKTKSGWRGFSITGITSGVTTLSSSYGDVSSEFTNSSLIVYDDLNNTIEVYNYTGSTYDSGTNTTKINLSDTNVNLSGSSLFVSDLEYDSDYADSYFGSYSHSEGDSTRSIGLSSHSEGLGTISLGGYQHTSGQYNVPDSTGSSFIVGNGNDEFNRRNLLFVGGLGDNGIVNVSGKTITTNLQVTSGATIGYVLTSTDNDGNVTWTAASGLTGTIKKYSETLPNPSGGTYTITHNLDTKDIQVSLWLVTTGDLTNARVTNRQTNSVDVIFSTSPGENVRVVIIG